MNNLINTRTQSPSRMVAVLAVILALTFVTSLLPAVFLLPLIVTSIIFGYKYGFVASCFFAAVSIMYAFMMPTTPVAVSFTLHPWVAIVPRLTLGIACAAAFKGATRVAKSAKRRYIREFLPVHIAATVASVTNTVLVVGCLVIFYGNQTVLDTTIIMAVPYMLIMSVVEIIVVNAVCPLLILAIRKYQRYRPATRVPIEDEAI